MRPGWQRLIEGTAFLGEIKVVEKTLQWSYGPWQAKLDEDWQLTFSDRKHPGWAVWVHALHPHALPTLAHGIKHPDMMAWARQVLTAARSQAERESGGE